MTLVPGVNGIAEVREAVRLVTSAKACVAGTGFGRRCVADADVMGSDTADI